MKKIVLFLSLLFICVYVYSLYDQKVTIIHLPKGELKWSKTKPVDAKLCVPAAFSTAKNYVVGSHKINGKSYGKSRAYCTKVSLIDGTFVTNKQWKSDNGFQQILLVKNNVPIKFKGSIKKCIRRALCKDKNKTFLIESNYPMTMSTFAKYCSEHCSDAVYLDMGEYGFGYVKKGIFTIPLYPISIIGKHKQTNWLYIK